MHTIGLIQIIVVMKKGCYRYKLSLSEIMVGQINALVVVCVIAINNVNKVQVQCFLNPGMLLIVCKYKITVHWMRLLLPILSKKKQKNLCMF